MTGCVPCPAVVLRCGCPALRRSSVIVSSAMDSNIRVWNAAEGTLDKMIDAGPGTIAPRLCAVLPVWSGPAGAVAHRAAPAFDAAVDTWSIAHSPVARQAATGSQSGRVNLWDLESGDKTRSLDTHGKFVMSVAYVRRPRRPGLPLGCPPPPVPSLHRWPLPCERPQ